MKNKIKLRINMTLRSIGFQIISTKTFEKLLDVNLKNAALERWTAPKINHEIKDSVLNQIISGKSQSQIQQDALVSTLAELSNEKERFFVEFGATDGINLSNTYALEKHWNWTGILVEPGKNWHQELKNNRSSIVDHRCVWSISGESILFHENRIGELSGVLEDIGRFKIIARRLKKKSYKVETVSLHDLLKQHNAPERITYLSIDTEGSEYEIIKDFDFNIYRPMIISIEHNYSQDKQSVLDLLTKFKYKQIYSDISEWDAWFIDIENYELDLYLKNADVTI